MNKISLLILCTLLALSAFPSDNDDRLIGVWSYKSLSAEVETSDSDVTESLTEEFTYLVDTDDTIEFGTEGKAVFFGLDAQYTVDKDQLTISYRDEADNPVTIKYTYLIAEDGMLTLSEELKDSDELSDYKDGDVEIIKCITTATYVKVL